MPEDEKISKMEQEYFTKYIDRQEGDVTVDYAADLPSDKFGSGFPTKGCQVPGSEEFINHPWNLNNLRHHEGSLLSFFGETQRISGITLPWVYMGMKWSSFCWHFEDLMLYSVNYMHVGGSKVWYTVPAADRKKFD
jgi:histone demethylase JARID1